MSGHEGALVNDLNTAEPRSPGAPPGPAAQSGGEPGTAAAAAQEAGAGGGRELTTWYMVKNTALLSCCYGIGIGMLFLNVGTTTKASELYGSTSTSTVPFALLLAGCALSAFGSQKGVTALGARPLYFLGGAAGVTAGGLYIAATATRSFALLCVGCLFNGFTNSTVNFLRFEVAQFVTPRLLPRGISAVVGGGVAGAVMGPLMSQHTRHLLPTDFQGTYVFVTGLFALQALLVLAIDFKPPAEVKAQLSRQLAKDATKPRPLSAFFRMPRFVIGVLAGATSFAQMAGLMLAMPLAFTAVQPGSHRVDFTKPSGQVYNFGDSSNLILAHAVVMFFPSFFLGKIIDAIGTECTIVIGFCLALSGTAVFTAGNTAGAFYPGALLLGAGWNFSFVGATAQVAALHTPGEKEHVRGFNDCFIFTLNTICVATAAPGLRSLNSWTQFATIYAIMLAPFALMTVAYCAYSWSQRRSTAIVSAPAPDLESER